MIARHLNPRYARVVDAVLAGVPVVFGMDVDRMHSRNRTDRDAFYARCAVALVCRKHELSFPAIARAIKRDHAIAIEYVRAARRQEEAGVFGQQIERLRKLTAIALHGLVSVPIVYVAHPYGGDRANLARARRWLAWLWRQHVGRYGFTAPWIDACEALPETAENRAAGIAFDVQAVQRCEELWLVGGAISPGMREEMRHARKVIDLTHLGDEPPMMEAA